MYYKSSRCRFRDWTQPFFHEWCAAMRSPLLLHRKQWEHVYIAEALRERGALVPGARGLALGAGRELLPVVFAEMGCEVTATDLQRWEPDPASELSRSPAVARIAVDVVDMRTIPDSYRGFDFTWSACSMDHLGSIDAGLQFVVDSLAVLRPGGIAVHTTELNVSTHGRTIESGPTVFFRAGDFERVRGMVAPIGYMEELDFEPGDDYFDRFVDQPPYPGVCPPDIGQWDGERFEGTKAHLVLDSGGHEVTSAGMLVRKH
jgi:2-polyprenyl-3-methyl-5-hydroxy-6-metoxy-1,4-benzoquinol methylase